MSKIRKNYYSLIIRGEDPNYAKEVEILEHENCIQLDDEDIDTSGNHYKTMREAKKARSLVLKAMKLKDEYPELNWKPGGRK
jgi:hypothetical protein